MNICEKYRENRIENADFEAKELICHFAGITKTEFVFKNNEEVSDETVKVIYFAVNKRVKHFPLQYIIGEWSFYGNDFEVGTGVLIPRPETEEIVYRANEFLKNKKDKTVFDLCAGTGCIGISVAKCNPECTVYLFEISDDALKFAENNIVKNNVDNVKLIKYDITDGFDKNRFPYPDVILSNPPYIPDGEIKNLQSEVCFEPETALKGGIDGMYFYKFIRDKWIKYINKDGMFMLETGEEQCEILKHGLFSVYNVSVLKDIYGVDRFICSEIEI